MIRTPISVLKEARANRLQLEVQPDGLHGRPSERCSRAFQDTLRDHKPQLLVLLALPFVMVESRAFSELLFFCQDEATKRALIDAGADVWTIYTRAELRVLCEQNRIAPLSLPELAKLHEIKKTFKATIAE